MILNLNFLPARYGDSIWIEYGDSEKPNIILIDGGTAGTKREIKEMISSITELKHIELLVVTHIDRDHIEGILNLLEEETLDFTIGSIWFNGWNHLPGNEDIEVFGSIQGERLTAAILKHKINWNSHFNTKAVVKEIDGIPPVVNLIDGFKITLLSPTPVQLEALKPEWKKELENANLVPGFGLKEPEEIPENIEQFGVGIIDVEELCLEKFVEDKAVANGSSIAFLAEYGGKRILFAGDSFPSIILNSLNNLHDGVVPIDLVKISHHASAGNTSPELLDKLDCKKYVISTNGSIYHHPSEVTIARILKQKGEGTELIFNYRTKYNEQWDNEILKLKYKYITSYPDIQGTNIKLI